MTVHQNYDLGPLLWYKIGGRVRYLLSCKNKEDVLEAIDFTQKNNIQKVFFLGIGSNLIFTDEYFDGAIIYMEKPDTPSFIFDGDVVTAYAGEILGDLVLASLDKGLTGLEWAGGLPGTVGAGVRGNVGAFGGEIKDSVVSCEVAILHADTVEVRELSNADLNFSYRTSTIKLRDDMVVISANFQLKNSGDTELKQARNIYESNVQYRQNRHPLELPNCGSVFKNISNKQEVEKILEVWPDIADKVTNDWHGKVSMGYIINRLGFDEYRVGNAQVSHKHNNFIVNLGGATAKDVQTIITDIQEKAFQEFGFKPEVEVEIVE